jgi:amino acid transporter
VIAALVVLRILLQFLMQHAGVIYLRRTQPEMKRPFRIWLYPLPPLVAIAGFLYILVERPHFLREIAGAGAVLAVGTAIYLVREWVQRAGGGMSPDPSG